MSRQAADDDDDDDRCATCVSLNVTRVTPELCLFDDIVAAYGNDPDYADIIAYLRASSDVALKASSRSKRDHFQRYTLDGDLLLYRNDQFDVPRTVIANDMDFRARIIMSIMILLLVSTWATKRLLRLCVVIFSGPLCINGCATGFVRAKSDNE